MRGELLKEDQEASLSLPGARFDVCRKRSTTVSSLFLVRFEGNDYSVPVRYAHHTAVVKGYVDRVEICRKDRRMAVHERLWGKAGVRMDPAHYLALLERKPGALDDARALQGWDLPECFGVLGRRLQRPSGRGRRRGCRSPRPWTPSSSARSPRSIGSWCWSRGGLSTSGAATRTSATTRRRCFMMEIDALYCDVIVQRWEQFTGQKAARMAAAQEATHAEG